MKTPSPQPSPRAGEGVCVAKVNALREWWSSRASVVLARIETPSVLDKPLKEEL